MGGLMDGGVPCCRWCSQVKSLLVACCCLLLLAAVLQLQLAWRCCELTVCSLFFPFSSPSFFFPSRGESAGPKGASTTLQAQDTLVNAILLLAAWGLRSRAFLLAPACRYLPDSATEYLGTSLLAKSCWLMPLNVGTFWRLLKGTA